MEKYLRVRAGAERTAPMEAVPPGCFDPEPPPRSRDLLAAYFDLESPGPLHAQCAVDAGRRLMSGAGIPVYQTIPLQLLREVLEAERPEGPNPRSPEDLCAERRSAPWHRLCDMLARWQVLPTRDRSRVVSVLAKLGFWKSIVALLPAGEDRDSLDSLRMSYLRHVAKARISPTPEAAAAPAYTAAREVTECIARNQDFDPVSRHGAAAHMIVLDAKIGDQAAVANMREALRITEESAALASDELSPLHLSTFWRAVAFIPFFEGDHAEVNRQLRLAESYAAEAVSGASGDDRLLALENMYPVLETSGRSAKARGDKEAAEAYYRRMAEWDPLDPRGHIRLADFLTGEHRTAEALNAYRVAARLGAPYGAYAYHQTARCLIKMGQAKKSFGALVAAASIDPRALSPLIMLRNVSAAEGVGPLAAWAQHEVVCRMGKARVATDAVSDKEHVGGSNVLSPAPS